VSYPEATEAIALIGEMFLLELDLPSWSSITDERLRAQALAQIRETRSTHTKPLLKALAAWAKAQRALPRSMHVRLSASIDEPNDVPSSRMVLSRAKEL
jgi:hypothetical protein